MNKHHISTFLKDSEKTNYEVGMKAPWTISTFPVMWDVSHGQMWGWHPTGE